MPRFIVVPLYDHVTAEEAVELANELERTFQLSRRVYVSEDARLPVDVELQRAADELEIELPA